MCESKLELFLEEVLKSKFFSNRNIEQNSEEERKILIMGMMLLDDSDEKHDCNMRKNTLRSAIEYLEHAFPEGGENIPTEDIPILIYLADMAEYKEIEPERFREWWCARWNKKSGGRNPPDD